VRGRWRWPRPSTTSKPAGTCIIGGTEIRGRRLAAGRKDRGKFISGKSKQNAVKTMTVTDGDGRDRFCRAAQHNSYADIPLARQLGLLRFSGCRRVVTVHDPRGMPMR
jgi:hypothetical protein